MKYGDATFLLDSDDLQLNKYRMLLLYNLHHIASYQNINPIRTTIQTVPACFHITNCPKTLNSIRLYL